MSTAGFPAGPTAYGAVLLGRPATRLVVAALHADPAVLAAEVARAPEGVWGRVLAAAGRHRVLPLLGALAEAPGVPERARDALRRRAHRAAQRQLRQAAALADVLAALTAAGVPALALKGPVLSGWLYGDVARRPSRDLDVLIDRADVGAAVEAVVGAGFDAPPPPSAGWPERRLSPAEAEVVAREFAFKEAVFVDPRRHVLLELHWRPFRDPGLPTLSGALQAGRTLDHGPSVPAVGPEAAVAAHVLVHGAFHGFGRLLWLADVAALARRADPETLVEAVALARADGLERAALLGPFLAGRLLGATFPKPIEERIAALAPSLRRLAGPCAHALRTGDDAALKVRLYDRRLDRLRSLWRQATVPSERELLTSDLAPGSGARLRRAVGRPLGVVARALGWGPRDSP